MYNFRELIFNPLCIDIKSVVYVNEQRLLFLWTEKFMFFCLPNDVKR